MVREEVREESERKCKEEEMMGRTEGDEDIEIGRASCRERV